MATWRHIGAGVVVSAGVLFTGTVTYRYVSGEAVATLCGAANERNWAYATDDPYNPEAVSIPASTVTVFAVKSSLQQAVAAARGHVTGRSADRIYWLDPGIALPDDGAEVARAAPFWTSYDTLTGQNGGMRTIYRYFQTGPYTNTGYGAKTRLITLDTRSESSQPFSLRTVSEQVNLSAANELCSFYYPSTGEHGDYVRQWTSTEGDYYGGLGNWWMAHLSDSVSLATNLYVFTPEETFTSDWGINGWFIRTNILRKTALVLSDMTRSVCFTDYAYATNRQTRDFNVTTNGSLADAKNAADALAWTDDGAGWSDGRSIAKLFIKVSETDEGTTGGDSPGSLSVTNVQFAGRQTRWYGASLAYPSGSAYASGVVSRVRVFAVASGCMAWPVDCFGDENGYGYYGASFTTNAGWSYSYTVDNMPDGNYYNASYTLGVSSAVTGRTITMSQHSNFSSPDGGAALTPTYGIVLSDFDTFKLRPDIIKWSLLADVSDPTNAPSFDFLPPQTGTDGPWTAVTKQTAGYDSTGPAGGGAGGGTDFYNRRFKWYNQDISLQFVVVVDWKFSMLNGATNAVAPYTPEWLSTNAP